MASEPKVLLVGCGGIGGVTAAQLARAGCHVTVVTGNPEVNRAIDSHGVRVRDLDGKEWSQPLERAVCKASDLFSHDRYDLCLLATKLTTLREVCGEVRPLLVDDAPILCLQNGLPESHAAAVVGESAVVGCVVGFGATLLEPGFSQRTSSGGFQIGRYRPRTDDRALTQVAELLGRAIPTKITTDLQGVRWSKLAINCATSTLGAIGGDTLGRLLSHRFVRRLVLEVWRELCALADCEKIRLAKVAGTIDIAKLALSDEDKQQQVGSLQLFLKHAILLGIGLKFRRMRSSMAVALERGRKPEIDWLNGEIVRRGAEHGVPTPLNRELVALVHDIAAKRVRPGLESLYGVYLRLESGQLGTAPVGPSLTTQRVDGPPTSIQLE